DYHKYIASNGGSCNAYTAETHTNYHFDISTDFLAGALDRFAQFFIEPLFTESATERELNAVNSEYERNIPGDGWRNHQLEKSLSDPNHDYSKFSIGNNESLKEIPYAKGIDVRQELLSFHERWYSANIMSLVVLGKESIQELQELVIPMFSGIKNNSAIAPKWTTNPFTTECLQKQCFIVPNMDYRSLTIKIPVPDMTAHYKFKPYRMIGHIIGHEGPGSLLSELKARNLCTRLTAGASTDGHRGFAFTRINVDLTEQAMDSIDDIISLVFQYINLLKREGPKQWIFDELKQMQEIRFRFKEKERPMGYVIGLSRDLHDYPFDECLSAGYLLDEFRPDLITDLLNHLTPDRMRVTVVSKQFTTIADQTEKWFSTQYTQQDILPEKIQKWLNIGFNDNLALPPPNDFIPYDFSLKTIDDNVKQMPQMIRNTEFSRVWHLQDNQYRTPKAYYKFKLTNPLVYDSPMHSNCSSLFTKLFMDSINEYSYSAELAGLYYNFYYTETGLNLTFGGYNDKLNSLMTTVLDKLIEFKVNPKKFEVFKDKQIRGLNSYQTHNIPYLLGYYTGLNTIDRMWTFEELIETANVITVDDVSALVSQLLSRFHIEALIHGNIDSSEAIDVCDVFETRFKSALNTKPIPLSQHFRNRVVQLPDGSDNYFEAKNGIHKTNAIQLYFQIGVSDTIINATIGLLQQILSEPFFDSLRTKLQLGYVVWASYRMTHSVRGMTFTIESDYKPNELNERIEAFIQWVHKYIEDMSDKDFETQKQSVITRRLEKPKQLSEYSQRLWSEISSKDYDFNRDEIEAKAIKELTKQDIIAFFERHLSHTSTNRKKLTVSIISENPINEKHLNEVNADLMPAPKLPESIRIENITQFKTHLGLYSVRKPVVDVYAIV
ncbi:unnamed protein product, partial [Oppiella nova]